MKLACHVTGLQQYNLWSPLLDFQSARRYLYCTCQEESIKYLKLYISSQHHTYYSILLYVRYNSTKHNLEKKKKKPKTNP